MLEEEFYKIIKNIPEGKVATYGQVAKLAGKPNNARQVGAALRKLKGNPDSATIPWHRVVNSAGNISERGLDGCESLQKIMLEEEGISFKSNDSLDLLSFQWQVKS